MRSTDTLHRTVRLLAVLALSAAFTLLATADALPGQEPDPQVVEQGKAVYEDQCMSCHGAEGKGDGPAARFVSPKPRDLSTGEFQHAEDGTVAAVAAVIRNGVGDGGPMTPFEGQLTDEQITAVATYVVHVLVDPAAGR